MQPGINFIETKRPFREATRLVPQYSSWQQLAGYTEKDFQKSRITVSRRL
jgi:hypothetical protein